MEPSRKSGEGADAAVPILLNPRAGRDAEGAERTLGAAFREQGVAAEVHRVPPSRLAAELASRAAGGASIVGVGGGDGSLLAAANALAGSDTALLPIPTGTLNHFARRLGNGTVGAAVRALAAGRISRVPLGVVDDGFFLNTATFGLYADVVRRRERLRPWLSKWPAAAVGSLEWLLRMRRMEVVLEVKGERLHRSTPLVWVGVGWGSFPFVHRAPERRTRPDLEIVVVRPGNRLGLVALLARLVFHLLRGRERPVDDPALEVFHARQFLIRGHHRIGVTLDGEVARMRPPIFIAIQDDALRVVAPASDPPPP